MGLAKWSPVALFIQSGPEHATRTGLIMLIYSNGIVIMWQAACCAVCLASDSPVITGMPRIHQRHFNNLANKSLKRICTTAALTFCGEAVLYGNVGFF